MTRNGNSLSTVPAARRRASRRNNRGGTLLGVFIGLVLGLMLAAGVAYYVAKANSPYAAKDARDAGRDTTRDSGKSAKTDASATDKPRFDFYKILPGAEEPKVQVERKIAPDRAVIDQAKDKEAERAPAKVAAAGTSGQAAGTSDRLWLQAGAFAAGSDAENLKAPLAAFRPEGRREAGTPVGQGS